MNRIKAIIIEDEEIFSSNLVQILSEIEPLIDIVAIFGSIEASINWLKSNSPDLIFLDIHLSDGSGFEIFEKTEVLSPVIFLTSYDQYAIKAFKLNSIDYLLKPLNIEELKNAVEKFKRLSKSSFHSDDYQELIKVMLSKTSEYKKRFVIYAGDKIKTIDVKDIAYFFVLERDTYIRTRDGSTAAIDYSLDKLESFLDPEYFFRINRKCIISIASIKQMFLLSKSRIKVEVEPPADIDTSVSLSRIPDFRKWLNK